MKRTQLGIAVAVLALISASIACQALTPDEPATAPPAAATSTVAPAAAPADTAAPTEPPEPAATEDPCISWDEVTTSMKGEVLCVRGVITKFDQSRQVGTRYSFSDKSGTFFLYSAKYEIIDPNTGKTVAPGTCVEVTAPVDVQSETPFINLDKLIDSPGDEVQGFLFYEEASACG